MLEVTESGIDAGVFWRAIGARPVGATVVTATGPDEPAGFLGLSFAHVSAVPPTVLVSAGRSASALSAILASGVFAINLLPAGCETLARAFGGKQDAGERFEDGAWESFATGAPVLRTAACVFDCRFTRTVDEAGAVILIGRVAGLRISDRGGVTLAAKGGYRDL